MNPSSKSIRRKERKMVRKAKALFKSGNACPTRGLAAFQNPHSSQEKIRNTSCLPSYEHPPNELSNKVHSGINDHLSRGYTENKFWGSEQLHQMKPSSVTSSPFPDLVILYDPFKNYDGIRLVNRCLKEFNNYGPLCVDIVQVKHNFKVSVLYKGMVLAEGQGIHQKTAELVAGARLLQVVRSTNYVIEPSKRYFPNSKKLPAHVGNVDPSQRHIYKVVCMEKPNEKPLYELSGAVDYVQSEDELWQYINHHIASDSYADLYILNLEVSARQRIRQMFIEEKQFIVKKISGTFNKGIGLFRNKSIQQIFQELKDCGGENIKYRLVPPGCNLGWPRNIPNQEKEYNEISDTKSAVDILRDEEGDFDQDCMDMSDEEQIEVPQWIAKNLIIMDFFKENNNLENPFNTMRLSVKMCRDVEEFLVEMKFDRNTSLYKAEAFIDRKLIGRGKALSKNEVKRNTCAIALQNLKNSCCYIQAKSSYFQRFPPVLKDPMYKDKIFRVVDPQEGTSEAEIGNILLKFRNSRLEDLFFLKNFSFADQKLVISLAKDMGLSVRYIINRAVCVYKKQYPKQIYRMLSETGENEKYKLIIPPARPRNLTMANKSGSFGNKEAPRESQIKNLFDFESSNVDPPQQVKSESNQSEMYTPYQASRQNEREQLNYIPENRSRNLTMANKSGSFGNKEAPRESQIKNLFDFESSNVDPPQQVKSESNQSEMYTPYQASRQNEREQLNYIPENRSRNLTMTHKTGPFGNKEAPRESQIKNLVDFESSNVDPPQQVKIESNQSEMYTPYQASRQNEREQLNYIPENRSRNSRANELRSFRSKEPPKEHHLKNLFDFAMPNVNTSQKIESNQSDTYTPYHNVTSVKNEKEQFNYIPIENNRDQNWQRLDGHNRGWHSGINKRSYAEGPGISEEHTSSYSQNSYNNQSTSTSWQSFKEKGSLEFNNQTKEFQDNSLAYQSRRSCNAPLVVDYQHKSENNQRQSNDGQYYQHEQQRSNERYCNKQERWSNNSLQFNDDRFL